jgi:tRNA threonylcarbamoyl adenosine modification protein YjeE
MSESYFRSETVKIAADIKGSASPTLLLLEGPLGAGKTTFTKELLAELGFDAAQVQSPTFLKLLEYQIPNFGLCLHIDTYRMEEVYDLERLSLESYENAALIIVEWPELFLSFFEARPWLFKIWNSPRILKMTLSSSHQLNRV